MPWKQSSRFDSFTLTHTLTHSHPHQGSVAVGIKSETHVVLVALKRSSDELSSYQKKIYPIDDHVAVAIAGLTSDGRMLG